MKYIKHISTFLGALVFLLAATSFNVHAPSPDYVVETAFGVDVKIYVKKGEDEHFTSEDVPPTLRLCQWPSDFTSPSFDESDSKGKFLTLENFDALSHPTLIHLEHEDFVTMQTGGYNIKKVGCSSDSNDVYVIPQFYFDASIFGCNVGDITLTMRPKTAAEKEQKAIAGQLEGQLDGGSSQPPGRGPNAWQPPTVKDKEILVKAIKKWAWEYSRLDDSYLSKDFKNALARFKRGQLKTVSKIFAGYNWDEKALLANTFEAKRELEQLATLAARTEMLLGSKVTKVNKYYEIADMNAPYQVPVKQEFVDYLIYKGAYNKAEKVLEPGFVRTPLLNDLAELTTSLCEVYTLNGKEEQANFTIKAELATRNSLKDLYQTRGIKNTYLIEANNNDIKQLQKIDGTFNLNEKKELREEYYLDKRRTSIYYTNLRAVTTQPEFQRERIITNDNRAEFNNLTEGFLNAPKDFKYVKSKEEKFIKDEFIKMQLDPKYVPSAKTLQRVEGYLKQ
ncbi:MAG: hypothetical protein AAFZ15_18300 [Bacteroidota bacterium]